MDTPQYNAPPLDPAFLNLQAKTKQQDAEAVQAGVAHDTASLTARYGALTDGDTASLLASHGALGIGDNAALLARYGAQLTMAQAGGNAAFTGRAT